MKRWKTSLILVLCGLAPGCSLKRTIAVGARPLFDDVILTLQRETDVEIARASLASDIKLIDALRLSQPKDRHLALLAVQARTSYAMGFVETESAERASGVYRKAMDDGFSLLDRRKGFASARQERNEAGLVEALERMRGRDYPLLFWTFSAWASWVNQSRDDPEATSQLSLVMAGIQQLLEEDETFFFGGPHLMTGVLYASRTVMLGGDPEKGRSHIERCIEISKGKHLMARVLLAEYYAVQTQNKEVFREQLEAVLSFEGDAPEDLALLNEIARLRAQDLLLQEEDLFF